MIYTIVGRRHGLRETILKVHIKSFGEIIIFKKNYGEK